LLRGAKIERQQEFDDPHADSIYGLQRTRFALA